MQLARFQREMMQPVGGVGVEEIDPAEDPRTILNPHTGQEIPITHPLVVMDPVPGDIRNRAYVARTEDDAKELQQSLRSYRSARDAINQYRELARTADKQWANWPGRARTQAQTDLQVLGRRAAQALANFERSSDASANYVKMIQDDIPGIETKGSRNSTIETIDRLVEGLDRDMRRGFFGAGAEPPPNLDEMGEPPAGYEAGISQELQPSEDRVRTFRTADPADEALTRAGSAPGPRRAGGPEGVVEAPRDAAQSPIVTMARDLIEPDVGLSREEEIRQLHEHEQTIEMQMGRMRVLRDEAEAAGNSARARELEANLSELHGILGEIRARRDGSAAGRRRTPTEPVQRTGTVPRAGGSTR